MCYTSSVEVVKVRFPPVFVYGTLRRGQGNYRLLAAATVGEFAATAPDHVLYSVGLPYVADRPGSAVTGELMVLDRAVYAPVLGRLDRLEGFRENEPEFSHYVRVCRMVRYQDGRGRWRPRRAWIYHAGPGTLRRLSEADVLACGDWMAGRAA